MTDAARQSATRRPLARRAAWAVPVAVATAVAGAALLPSAASADPHPVLPALTAAELLVKVQGSQAQALSGTVVETARLGLPTLPGADNSASFSWQSLVTGSHTARIWVDGPDRQRIALVGQLAESDLVHSGQDLWTYTSGTQAVTHAVLPAEPAGRADAQVPDARSLTPAAAAAQALASVDPTTLVRVDATARIAGRPAYTLVLSPRDTRSTVQRVELAVDSETSVPLRVQIYGSAAEPAFETGFTDVSFTRPAESIFRFSPPAGATVTTRELPTARPGAEPRDPAAPSLAAPTVVGTGWTSVLVLPAGSAGQATGGTAGAAASSATDDLLGRLSTTLPNGDKLVTTPLLRALITTDGRVLLGAVGTDLLQQAASGPTG